MSLGCIDTLLLVLSSAVHLPICIGSWHSRSLPVLKVDIDVVPIAIHNSWSKSTLCASELSIEPCNMSVKCDQCGLPFFTISDLKQHRKQFHDGVPAACSFADSSLVRLQNGYSLHSMKRAMLGYLQTFQIRHPDTKDDASTYLNDSLLLCVSHISHMLSQMGCVKALLSLKVSFDHGLNDKRISGHFNSTQHRILDVADIKKELVEAAMQIMGRLETFIKKGSGWVVDKVDHLDIHIAKYQPLRGSTYKSIPRYLQLKKAIVNVKNNDNKCFLYSILASLFSPAEQAQRPSKYAKYLEHINMVGISYPVSLDNIDKVEQMNRNLAINVFGFDKDIIPLRISTVEDPKRCADLMLYQGHYTCIKSLDRLLSDQRGDKAKKFFCRRCLLPQYSEQKLCEHWKRCSDNEIVRTTFPRDTTLKFSNFDRTMRAPYVIYADFESILEPIQGCQSKPEQPFTQKCQHHEACGFGVVDVFDCCGHSATIGKPKVYRGPDTVEKFLDTIVVMVEAHQERLNSGKPLNMTPDDWETFNTQNICHICHDVIGFGDKAKDHCHLCGKFRGVSHLQCNINYRLKRDVCVLFHNLRRYDGHLIMNKLAKICRDRNFTINCIPKGMEDYLAFSLTGKVGNRKRKVCDDCDGGVQTLYYRIKFIDSFQFLPASLGDLTDNLINQGKHSFKAMVQEFGDTEICDLLLRKGIYPYEYMDSSDRFAETSLPPKGKFYSSLSETHISEADYRHAQTVWQWLNVQNLGEYHDLYLKTDVLLLADVFENFRRLALKNYKLDPTYYATLPSFAWDACLKLCNAKLELVRDADMYNFFEKGIRGGVSMISHRYAKANNPEVARYDASKKNSFIIYLDANNLYGWSMMQRLPMKDFRWLSLEEILRTDWENVDTLAERGWILEVDLEYPQELHNHHNDYPLAPERLTVTDNMLSPYSRKLKEELSSISGSVEKLVPNLWPKKNYVVHCRNLQLYLSLGLKLTRVHRVVEFLQEAWLAPYIKFNTDMRKQAKNEFEKDFFKLLNNAVFGKTMENVRAYQDIKLVTEYSKFKKLVANPRYKESTIFDESLVAVSMAKASVCLCKPIYVGFAVLDLSKYLMYDFHFNYVKETYADSAKLLFTDTDSLCYWIETNNVYDDMKENKELFDTSGYPSGHNLFCLNNKKVLGKMKDETAGVPIEEFVGLRSKMYSFKYGNIETKRAKGVKRAVVKKHLRHDHFKAILFGQIKMQNRMAYIRSDMHYLYTVIENKTTLSAFDDKRYILNDGCGTLAYGHYIL